LTALRAQIGGLMPHPPGGSCGMLGGVIIGRALRKDE